MGKVLKNILVVALAVVFTMMNATFMAGEVLALSQPMEDTAVRAGALCGKVVAVDGVGVANAVVKLTATDGREVTAVTEESGDFSGLSVEPGGYTLTVNGILSMPLTVTADSEISKLAIVLPNEGYSAGASKDEDSNSKKVVGIFLLVTAAAFGLASTFDSGSSGAGDCP
jgi:hypothetical protein